MNVFAMYGIAGLVSVSLLFFGMYSVSAVVGTVTYQKGDTQAASVIVTHVPELEEKTQEVLIEEDEDVKEVHEDDESASVASGASTGSSAPTQEDAPEEVQSDTTTSQSDVVATLQEQVNTLLDQVAEASGGETNSTEEASGFFVTPTGVRIDANGNVVNDSGEVVASTEETESSEALSPLPSGYYRLPTGVVIGPGGVVVNENDIVQATQQEEQSNITSLDYFITPSGEKIDRYGNIIEE